MMSSALPRWLILLCLTACAPAKQEAAPPVSVPNKDASAACGSTPAATAASKVRHIPDENDPCADSRGLPTR